MSVDEDSPSWVLACLGAELEAAQPVEVEVSHRLRRGEVEASGRFGCWLSEQSRGGFDPIARALERLGAPPRVLAAQRNAELPLRQGIAAAFGEDGLELRLYLHGRDPETLADRYDAWRWKRGAEPRRSRYSFHFFPETPAGQRPDDLVAPALRPIVARLLDEVRLQQGSGFWLREGADGQLEQVDLAFPWNPPAGSLTGLQDLAALLELPLADASRWRDLCIRHIAFRVGPAAPAATLYASAPLEGPWPSSEAALHDRVRRGARLAHRRLEQRIFGRLPPLAPPAATHGELDAFYGGDIEAWRNLLGPELHYHAALFDTAKLELSDEEMDRGLRRAVTELYPFLPAGGRIYDVGCGWGGPLAMWIRDLGCPSLGLTISRAQFRYIAARGLPVRWGDAERTLPPGHFACAVLLESLSHIRDKARLLQVLRCFAARLVMRVNCQDGAPAGLAFGGTMHMVSSPRLRELLAASGWRIRHWRDRRREALASVAVWRRRLRSLASSDHHIETLRAWSERVMTAPEAWARQNPLIEVVAD